MTQRGDSVDRKQAIAEAVLTITARHGLEAVSMRDVAAEARVSLGLVQHYFRTKDEMLLFACRYMIERAQARIQARYTNAAERPKVRLVLRDLFEQMLPLTEERRIAIRVWIAFLARAVVQPELEAFMRQTHMSTHQVIAAHLREGQRTGEVKANIDLERATRSIFMLVEGLVSHVQVGHYTGEQAMQAIDDRLAEVFEAPL
jgi:TetR/AcrR family transcriptional regulator, transcriptional repressor of bet genes